MLSKNQNKSIWIAIVIILVAVVGYFAWAKYQNPYQEKQEGAQTSSLSQEGEAKIKAAVFNEVEEKTGGDWDKQVEILDLHQSYEAAKGKWIAKDHWDWIAWQDQSGEWQALVSLDGFNCSELEDVPAEYDDFFEEVVNLSSGERFCY